MTKQTTPFGVFRVGCGRQTVMHLPSRRLVDAQPEAQHPKSSAIHKLAGRLPHLLPQQPTLCLQRNICRDEPGADMACADRAGPPKNWRCMIFPETGRFSKKNREAIKHEPGNRREGSVA
jgi:hypothetical protein